MKNILNFYTFPPSLSSFQCLSCSLLPTQAHSLPLKLVASILIIIVAYISVLIHSCSLLSSFIVARVYHQLVIEKPLVALSLKKTNSAFSVVIHCLQFFVWGWSKMRFPSYTLTHLLVMLLFKTCLGSQFFKISCMWLSWRF